MATRLTATHTCVICNRTFRPWRGSPGTYCSRACQATARKGLSGDKNTHWKGGRIRLADGRVAVYAPGHPGARLMGGSYILEYRLIAERKIGRALLDSEVVHHIDGDVTNNKPSNLQIMTASEHASVHVKQDPTTGRFIKKGNENGNHNHISTDAA